MNEADNPSRPRPTTLIPITVPDANETLNAGPIPLAAAFVVLPFAMVAVSIPTYPAVADNTAPKIKHNAVRVPFGRVDAIMIENKMTKTAIARYCLFR